MLAGEVIPFRSPGGERRLHQGTSAGEPFGAQPEVTVYAPRSVPALNNISLAAAATCAALLAVTGCGTPPEHNERLQFGKAEVLYTSNIQKSEAQQVGNILVREKYFGDRPATVQVRFQDRRYEVRCVVRAGVENEPQAGLWRKLADAISKECFRSSPVDMHLCDEHLKTLKVIPFQPLKPELPITVTFRRSIGRGSLVAQYYNPSGKYLTVSATLRNATLGQSREITLNIGPSRTVEHGWAEGWSYRSGETIDLYHADYESLHVVVP
jgi:hypothetical protein